MFITAEKHECIKGQLKSIIVVFVYLCLQLCLNGLQLLINLLDLPHHGRLDVFKSRQLPFSLVSLLFHALKLIASGLVLLVAEENSATVFIKIQNLLRTLNSGRLPFRQRE